ncbi:hypothetical protein MKW94_012862 [Papaver nudicaule]|uniref:FAR1 domain-containing protein n=1 Tax=Papaver nudicaule TaxID=74823 RepID=A0AA41VVI5_PAPNU|nr:hypothetical protein [Papaver nudicaule]
MVTFDHEDDNINSPENSDVENESCDGSGFPTTSEDGEELYNSPVGLLGDEIDGPDHTNTPVVAIVPNFEKYPDTSHFYRTEQAFSTRLDAKKWCVETGKQHNCALVTKAGSVRKRNLWTTGRGCRFELECERGGIHRSHTSKKQVPVATSKRKRDTGSKKIGCPFRLSVLCGSDSLWRVSVQNGWHSHDPPESLVGHSSSCLTQEQYDKVIKLRSGGMRPVDILGVLKKEYPGIAIHIRVIYNAISNGSQLTRRNL